MKRHILFLTIAFLASISNAQTSVSGNQSGIWTAANSPYEVTGHITVPTGQILTIEAGVEVNFQGHYKIIVHGGIEAEGTADEMIYFTTDNQATGWGGIHFDNTATISHFSSCRLEYGKATGDNYPDFHGGAVRLISSNSVFIDCIFADNDSVSGEGMGGAVYAINTGSSSEADTRFTNCSFLRNQAYSEGGAIKFTSDMNTEITNCEFIENSTSYGGGAIMFYSVMNTKLINSLFVDNYSNYSNGGALLTLGAGNSIYITNCTLIGNDASGGDGGALALYYGDAYIVNTIAYNNTAAYGGMYADNVYIDAGGGNATVNYSNMIFPEYNTTGSNNINTNPLFVNASADDYHLLETSPCIDTGTDVGLSYEGAAPDMGCYEYGSTVGIDDYQVNLITIYPNPANNMVHFEEIENLKEITLVDSIGKMIEDYSIDYLTNTINLSKLTTGVYFIRFKTETAIISKKIIKE